MPFFKNDYWKTNAEKKVLLLWLIQSVIIVLPLFVFLIFDWPDDNFKSYGRSLAQRYSIFQYTKLELERKSEHRIGKRLLREQEKAILLDKKKHG